MKNLLALHATHMARHTSGSFIDEISHSITRGFGWGVGRQFAHMLPAFLIIAIIIGVIIYYFAKNRK